MGLQGLAELWRHSGFSVDAGEAPLAADDAAASEIHALDPPDFPPGLPYPQPRDEPIRFWAEVMKPGEDFDPTGLELPLPPQMATADAGQGELFSGDYAQPAAADREPVFWSASGGQASPDDDCVQADAAASI